MIIGVICAVIGLLMVYAPFSRHAATGLGIIILGILLAIVGLFARSNQKNNP